MGGGTLTYLAALLRVGKRRVRTAVYPAMHLLGKRSVMALQGAVFYLLLTLLVFPLVSSAGSFGVTPIRLDFDRATKTGVLKISNDADDPLQVQMQAFAWTQDA